MKRNFIVAFYSTYGENDIQIFHEVSAEQAERKMLRLKGFNISDNETPEEAGIFDVEVFSKELE